MNRRLNFKDQNHEFILTHIEEYCDGELSPEIAEKFATLVESPGFKELIQRFKSQRGKLQLSLQDLSLTQDDYNKLNAIVEDAKVRDGNESEKIEKFEKIERRQKLLRVAMFTAAIIAVVGLSVLFLGGPRKENFDTLGSIGYEAIALEDDPEGRLDLQSTSWEEISQFLTAEKGLGFEAKMIDLDRNTWLPNGVATLDYDVKKITVVKFLHRTTNESLFYFTLSGQLKTLPPTEPGTLNGTKFQTYTSERHNFVAWDQDERSIGVLVGRLSARDLARLAKH